MKNTEKTMDKLVALCKGRGFIYPGSEIYGGLANTWDFGPLGVELKNNIKSAWRKKFIQECKYNVGLDSAILMNPQTWVASGHIGGFSDPLMDCKACKTRHRADNLIEDFDGTNCAGWSNEQMMDYIREKGITCLAAALYQSQPLSAAKAGYPGGVCVVIGSEGQGLTDETIAACNSTVRIPMTDRVESLNAGIAGSILLWHFREESL